MRFSLLPSQVSRRGDPQSRPWLPLLLLLALLLPGQSLAQSDQAQKRARALSLYRQGAQSYDRGDARKALSLWQSALRLFQAIGDQQGEGALLGGLGNAYNNLGDYRRAIDYHEQALKISREIEDRRGEGGHLGNLGNAYRDLGDSRRAIDYHEQALKISREIGDRRGEGNHLGNLGIAYGDLGDYRRAIDYFPRSRVLLDTRLIHDSWRKGCRDERTKARGGFGGGRP